MDACPGAPYCEQASVATQPLAERLSDWVATSRTYRGALKAAPAQRSAALCLTGRDGRFDVVVDGRADSAPVKSGVTESEALDVIKKLSESR